MKADHFRRLALSLPEATEVGHMGHPDFRVAGKIFATLGHPDAGHAMVKLLHEQQDALTRARPEVFAPVPGGWGRRGATYVTLAAADEATAHDALVMAWRNTAPKKLLALARRQRRAGVSFDRLCELASKLPGIEPGTCYGTPALRVKGKFLLRLKEDADTVAIKVPMDDREVLLQADPQVFYITDHYRGYPAILLRLSEIDERQLADLLELAWRFVAPPRLQRMTR